MKRALPPSGHNDLRVLLGRIETDMYMWSKGYEEISLRLLEQLLGTFQKAITITTDTNALKKIQSMMHQLESMLHALQHSVPIDHHQAKKQAQQMIEDAHAMRLARTSPLHPVEVEEVLGTLVIHVIRQD